MIKRIPLASLYPDKKFLLERIMCYLEKIFSFPEDDIADFSDTLFIFPSSEAGRLFREKAAVFFKSHGGVTELHTLLPEQLLFNPSYTEINPMQSINLWLDVLKKNAADSQFSLLSSGEDSTDEVLLPLAEYFSKVRENILLESGADSIDFTASLPDSILKNKLKEYLELEKIYRSKLNGHRDKAQVIADAALPDEAKIKNIILIECSELKNGICKFLERSSGAINVVHCLNIAENELEYFDNYGRPLTEKMIRVNPDFSLTSSFRSYSNPIAEAIKIASLLDKENLPSSIGVLDSELASSLTHMLEAKNIEVYAPQKKPLNSFYWCNLFNRMLKLRNRNIAFEDIFFWAQDDSFTNYAALDSTAVRREIELLQREHLLCNFESLAFFCRKYAQNPNTEQQYAASLQFCRALEQLAAKVRSIDESTLPEGLWETFAETASFNTLEFMDINSAENTLETLKNIIVQLRKIDEPSDRMLLFKYMCKTTNIANAEQFKDEALNLSGFLDLIWYENKSLIIGGISEEAFAGTAPEDMLFPENIRRQLNWSSADSRFGADIHRFNQLVKQYSSDEIFITFASANKSGSLYTLPRLLFTGSDTVLLEHCRLLFNNELNEKIAQISLESTEKIKLSAEISSNLSPRLSVTALHQYISCPYTFYLNNILYCNEPGRENFELQANQSGTLIHSVLEAYAVKYADFLPEYDELEKFCMHEFERLFHAQLGNIINNIAIMQAAEIKKSIIAFINCEQTFRKSFAKHKILHPEFKIDIALNDLWQKIPAEWTENLPLNENIKNIRLVGKIDRIDLAVDNNGSRTCCIIDYKTAKTPTTPFKAHLSNSNAAHLEKEKMIALHDTKSYNDLYFSDMQLVIYKLMAQFMRDKLNIPPDIPIKCGYFNLPEETAATGIVYFDELDDSMLQKSITSLHYLLHKIFVERCFWPPSLTAKYGAANTYFTNLTEDDFEKGEKYE